MNNNRLIHQKGRLYRLALALFVMLSIFSISGSVGLSSFQPQKTTTEFLWIGRERLFAAADQYRFKYVRCTLSRIHYHLQNHLNSALIRFNCLLNIRFSHQSSKFLTVKHSILRRYCSANWPNNKYEVLPA